MALIQCPDCDAEVSSLAAACPRCARPLAASAPPVILSPQFCCPSCRSPEVQKLSVIYELGSTRGKFGGGGVGIATGGIGGGVFGGKNQGQTLAAEAAAPPPEPTGKGAFVLTALAGVFILLCIVQLIGGSFMWPMAVVAAGFGVAAVFAVMNFFAQVRQHPQRRRTWETTWRCLRCGNTFADLAGVR